MIPIEMLHKSLLVMSLYVKICGLKDESLIASLSEDPQPYAVGFVFYPRSPRFVSAEQARRLSHALPKTIKKVAITVDSDDYVLDHILSHIDVDFLQCHGYETVERLRRIKERFSVGIIKALALRQPQDIENCRSYEDIADMILFDAPPSSQDTRPGGHGRTLEWSQLRGFRSSRPWFLSGGLTEDNLATAVRQSGASYVDVSSGVEKSPGQKDADKIRAFLARADQLPVSS